MTSENHSYMSACACMCAPSLEWNRLWCRMYRYADNFLYIWWIDAQLERAYATSFLLFQGRMHFLLSYHPCLPCRGIRYWTSNLPGNTESENHYRNCWDCVCADWSEAYLLVTELSGWEGLRSWHLRCLMELPGRRAAAQQNYKRSNFLWARDQTPLHYSRESEKWPPEGGFEGGLK